MLERAVSEVLGGDSSPEWLAEKLQKYVDIHGSQTAAAPEFIMPVRRQRRGNTVHGRGEAISEALSEIARQSEPVMSFRGKMLNGLLLPFEDVDRWIKERLQDETYPMQDPCAHEKEYRQCA